MFSSLFNKNNDQNGEKEEEKYNCLQKIWSYDLIIFIFVETIDLNFFEIIVTFTKHTALWPANILAWVNKNYFV